MSRQLNQRAIRRTISRLLRQDGAKFTLEKKGARTGSSHSPTFAVSTFYTSDCIIGNILEKDKVQSGLPTGTINLTLSAALKAEPTNSDLIEVNLEKYEITHVEPGMPSGVLLFWLVKAVRLQDG